jgi:hypothetical protein
MDVFSIVKKYLCKLKPSEVMFIKGRNMVRDELDFLSLIQQIQKMRASLIALVGNN